MLAQVADVDVEILNRQITIEINGAVDNQKTVIEIIKLLEENIKEFDSIQINVAEVEFVNTFFINGLIRVKRQFAVPVSLIGVNPSIRELLQISNIDRIIPIIPN